MMTRTKPTRPKLEKTIRYYMKNYGFNSIFTQLSLGQYRISFPNNYRKFKYDLQHDEHSDNLHRDWRRTGFYGKKTKVLLKKRFT